MERKYWQKDYKSKKKKYNQDLCYDVELWMSKKKLKKAFFIDSILC